MKECTVCGTTETTEYRPDFLNPEPGQPYGSDILCLNCLAWAAVVSTCDPSEAYHMGF